MAKKDEWFLNIRKLEDIDNEIAERQDANKHMMAYAILEGMRAHDEDGTLWELVEEMLKQDYVLTSRLEFIINSAVYEASLTEEEKGGRYAN
jgi:predicted RNA-binding protein